MAKGEATYYRKIRASELPREEQERLRSVLRHDLAEALINLIKANPPDVSLEEIELVLRPGQDVDDWSVVADCETCSTCGTGGGIAICATSSMAEDIPVGVMQQLGIEPRKILDVKNLKEIISCVERVMIEK